jgi:hypothetical protein
MDDSGEVVTTETTAARYVGGRAIDVAPVAQQAPGPGEVRIDVAFTGKVTKLDWENPNGGRACPG